MSKIAIVADSTSDIPLDLIQQHNIYIAPLHLQWDGVDYADYADGVGMTAQEFCAKLRTSNTLPGSGSASIEDFLRIFTKLRGKVDGVVAILLGSRMPSTAVKFCGIAKEEVTDLPIEIIDSGIDLVGLGLVVLAAARVAGTGADMETVVNVARETIPKVHIYYTPGDMEYTMRGARVHKVETGPAREELKASYIITFKDGRMVPLETRPAHEEAVDRMLQLMREQVTNTPLHAAVQYAEVLDEAKSLRDKIASEFKCTELWISEETPVMLSHLGPGTLGLAFYNE